MGRLRAGDRAGPSPFPSGDFEDFALGVYWNCALRPNEELLCITYTYPAPPTPKPVEIVIPDVRAASAGIRAVCMLDVSGTLGCAGMLDPPPAVDFEEFAAGDDDACGVTKSGSVVCWGADDWGETDVPEVLR
jgi:hypothetical protein